MDPLCKFINYHSVIYILPYVTHLHATIRILPVLRFQRDPTIYKKPLAFKPERWLEEDLELQADLETVGSGKSQLTKAFLTFSQGTHSCLGMNLAYLELRVVTALLVQNFEIRYHGPVPEIVNALLRLKESPLMEFHPLK